MAIFYNTSIVRNGLIVHYDAANTKSYVYRENLLTYSQQFTNAAWSANTITAASTSTLAPDGSPTANYLVPTVANSFHQINNTVTLNSGTTYTYSLYVKPAGYSYVFTSIYNGTSGNVANQKFNLVNGTVDTFWTGATGTPSINLDSNGWYRIAMTVTIPASGSYGTYIRVDNTTGTNYIFTADGVSGLNVWGAQLQQSPYLGKYVATTATTITPSTTWIDISGQSRNGTQNNPPIVYNPANQGCMQYNGFNNYTDLGINVYNLGIRRNATFSGWIYPTSTGASYVISDWNGLGMTLRTNSDVSADFYVYGATSAPRITYVYPFTPNKWYNLVAVMSGDTMYMYVNGVSSGLTQPLTEDIGSSPSTLKIGGRGDGAAWGSGHSQANLMIYNRALSAAEVNQNFQAQRDRYGV